MIPLVPIGRIAGAGTGGGVGGVDSGGARTGERDRSAAVGGPKR